jgi:hypothetical protein
MKTKTWLVTMAAVTAAGVFSTENVFAQAGRQENAIFLRDSGNVTLQDYHPSGISDPDSTARANIVDTAVCGTAETSNYSDVGETEVWLHSSMLSCMKTLVTSYGYTYRVTEIAGGDHSSTSYHYRGTAFDVATINGQGVSSSNPYWSTFNQRCRNMGSIESLGPGNTGHSTHVHNAWSSGTAASGPGGCIQNNASVVSMNYPGSVVVGSSFSATVTMRNNGGTHWVTSNGYALGSQNPQDNTRWGMGRVGFAGTISPGQNCAFTFNCSAPTTAGSYAFDWKMVQDGVEWFGATAGGGINVTAPSVIVDNQQATYTGSWATGSSAADKYGADYRYKSTAALSEPATFTGNIAGGSKSVYAWWPAGANRSTTTPYIVTHSGGSTTVNKNQQVNGGSWQLLGTWNFNAGNNTVKVSCWTTTGFVVVADAVKWE